MERELEKSELKQTTQARWFLASIVESSTEAIIGKALDGTIVSWNKSAEKMYGYTAEEMLGQSITRLFPADHEEEYEAIMAKVEGGEQIEDLRTKRVRRDGTVIDVLVTISPIVNTRGEVIGASAIAREISDRKRARLLQRERAAREKAEAAKKRLAFLSEASHTLGSSLDYETTLNVVARLAVPAIADWCAVDLLDERGSLRRVAVVHSDPEKVRLAYELQERSDPDPDAEYGTMRVIRSGQSELIAELPDSLLDSLVQDEEVRSLLEELGLHSYMAVPMQTHEKTLGAITFVTAESQRRFGSNDLELAQELARRGALAVENARLFRQVQELNAELEERVRRRTAELQATNKELEAFSYSVSHDLRAPLRAIDGFSQALQEDYLHKFDETGQHFLRRIRAGAQQMGQLIDDLLKLSRLSRHEMQRETVHLSALASAIAARLQDADSEREVAFEIEDTIVARGDQHLLRVVLENLLDNAWKFTSARDEAVIKFGRQENAAGEEVYYVGDNGVGFDMAYADKLFGAFQRLHSANEFPGTGIGLATVQRIIHRHGGRVWAEAEVDRGATFYFTLGKGEGREKNEHPAG